MQFFGQEFFVKSNVFIPDINLDQVFTGVPICLPAMWNKHRCGGSGDVVAHR